MTNAELYELLGSICIKNGIENKCNKNCLECAIITAMINIKKILDIKEEKR